MPTTSVSLIFVVFLGVGAITRMAAAIASAWIAKEERQIERELLDVMRRQLAALRETLVATSRDAAGSGPP